MKPDERARQIMLARYYRKKQIDLFVGVSMSIIGILVIVLFLAGVI